MIPETIQRAKAALSVAQEAYCAAIAAEYPIGTHLTVAINHGTIITARVISEPSASRYYLGQMNIQNTRTGKTRGFNPSFHEAVITAKP